MSFNANFFELKRYEPLQVFTYSVSITPTPKKSAQFYQILGLLAKKITAKMGAVVVSDQGKINILELEIPNKDLVNQEINIENLGGFSINLKLESKNEVTVEQTEQYSKLVNQIIDVAMTKLSYDYYKYSERAPFVFESKTGFFDETLKKESGIEDGTRFYRGLRIVNGKPYVLINREIELRSWKDLLNELKILGEQWAHKHDKVDSFDFYNPPEQFIKYANWLLRGKTAYVKKYPAPAIVINQILWEKKANDKIINDEISLVEYQKQSRGIKIIDENQPIIKYTFFKDDGTKEEQFQVPELLIVGHTFDDLSFRISKSKIAQVFDIVHPNCNDQQRKIFDFIRKANVILNDKFSSIYPKKLQFDLMPKPINDDVILPSKIVLKLQNKDVEVEPPYGINFYKKYSNSLKFAVPIPKQVKILAVVDESMKEFVQMVVQELEKRNGINASVDFDSNLDLQKTISYDLTLTVSDDDEFVKEAKNVIINQNGKAHQNINKKNVKAESIQQLAMNITLKLGGNPWLLETKMGLTVLSIKSYTNPFDKTRFYVYNIMSENGTLIFQSKPFARDDVLLFLRSIQEKIKNISKLLVLITFDDQQIEEYITKEISSEIESYLVLLIKKDDHVRLFSTYQTTATGVRRRRETTSYPIEAYEQNPQGLIMKASDREYYLSTTISTRIGTYHRGCPLPIKIRVVENKGFFKIDEIIQYLLSLCMEAGTSGHVTRLPAPLYYLGLMSYYINEYGLPSKDSTFENFFYV